MTRETIARATYKALKAGYTVHMTANKHVCTFYVFTGDGVCDRSGRWHPYRDYIRCRCWGTSAIRVNYKRWRSELAAVCEIAGAGRRGEISYTCE